MISVTKTYLVDTDSVDEAYDLTKISNDKVETLGVGQIRPYDPSKPAPAPLVPGISGTPSSTAQVVRRVVHGGFKTTQVVPVPPDVMTDAIPKN